jgi:polysaccharide pyruvyl transferase WcaK-like protein
MEAYFLDFANFDKKIISAAASFGAENVEKESKKVEKLYKYYLSNFDALGIREKSGVNYCKKLGINAFQLIDPVFYLTQQEWQEVAQNSKNKQCADCVYYTIDTRMEDDIKSFAKQNKEILNIDNSIENITTNTSIEEWLYKILNCKFFITDSFHGICFAIIFNKNFVCVNRNLTSSTRMKSLFEELGIKDRLYNSFSDVDIEKLAKNIPWEESINGKLKELTNISINWLLNAIESPNKNSDIKLENKKKFHKIKYKLAWKNYLRFKIRYNIYNIKSKFKFKKAYDYKIRAELANLIYKKNRLMIKYLKKNKIS